MKPYSLDFRQKIVEVYENEKISQRQLAERFRVALSFITKLLKQHRESGNLEPRKSSGRPPKLQECHLQQLETLVDEHNDWTEEEYREELGQRTGVEVSRATIGRALRHLKLTRKKKRSIQRRREQSECS